MTEALSGHGFEVRALWGAKASRAGILGAFRELVAETDADDAIVVHFSGHGGIVAEQTAGVAGCRYRQFMVPTDITDSGPDDFRGIVDVELSEILDRLTRKTANTTLILDCCHSAQIARDGARSRGLPEVWHQGLTSHMKHLARQGTHGFRHEQGNPIAVRLVACGRHQSAFEYPDQRHGPVGYLTAAVYRALTDPRMRDISWLTLGKWVRGLVMQKQPTQRPDLEGPVARRLFSLEEDSMPDVLELFWDSGDLWLGGGLLHGVSPGDVFSLQPATVRRDAPERECGTGRVVSVEAGRARLRTEPDILPGGLLAFPRKRGLAPYPVRTDDTWLLDRIEDSPFLRPALPDEVAAHVARRSGQHLLRDEEGRVMGAPSFHGEAILRALEHMARARRLVTLPPPEDPLADVDLVWGIVGKQGLEVLPEGGAVSREGDAVFVHLTNKGDSARFVSLLNVGIDAQISLLTANLSVSGVEMRPGESRYLGFDPKTGRCPWQLYWPHGIPRDEPRQDHLVAIVSEDPQDMSPLINPGTGLREDAPARALDRLIAQIGSAIVRNLERDPAKESRYAVMTVCFYLAPDSPSVSCSSRYSD